jgi:hypothetical protein
MWSLSLVKEEAHRRSQLSMARIRLQGEDRMTISQAQLMISAVALVLATSGAIVAWQTFLRSQRWKEAEFLAQEMKDFFADQRVQTALTMVDWGLRRMKLLEDAAADGGNILVDRIMQVRALRPHVLLARGSDEIGKGRFAPEEAAIRDRYDALLDGLERFGNYLSTKLVRIENMKPYIGYWLDDIHADAENAADAAWTACLLTYIDFYRFRGVQELFKAAGKPIDPTSEAYRRSLAQMQDRDLAAQLTACVKRN